MATPEYLRLAIGGRVREKSIEFLLHTTGYAGAVDALVATRVVVLRTGSGGTLLTLLDRMWNFPTDCRWFLSCELAAPVLAFVLLDHGIPLGGGSRLLYISATLTNLLISCVSWPCDRS